jgi:hypothetical protein
MTVYYMNLLDSPLRQLTKTWPAPAMLIADVLIGINGNNRSTSTIAAFYGDRFRQQARVIDLLIII